ncbi:MAG: UDP-2,4-diacetamido-2,4,6-trideoxy-beta-L-altropyranose hydrolase [Ilumatobacteraceae bacterium]
MTFAFRVDSSTRLGTGHLVRCLTLAQTLRSHDVDAVFLCRQLDGVMTSRVENAGFEVLYMGETRVGEDPSEREDAIESLRLIDERSLNRVIVDHYDLSLEWEELVTSRVDSLAVIDDFTNRQHRCNLLLNQNLVSPRAETYAQSLHGVKRALVGPRFALLQPDYALHRSLLPTEISEVKRIVVFMGGSDPKNVTEFVLRSLINMELGAITVDVVIGPSNPHRARLLTSFEIHRSIVFHFDLPSLAPLLARSDLAIGAGGISNWERMCLGVPSVVIDVAENQREICIELAQADLIKHVGSSQSIFPDDIERAVGGLISDGNLRRHYSIQGKITVDGLGASRVAEALVPSDRSSLTLRSCRNEDAVPYFNWANDLLVRKSSLNSEPITWVEHETWFMSRMESPTCRMYTLCSDSLPVGQIRFQREDDAWSINYSLDELVRGRDWGSLLVEQGLAKFRRFTTGKVVAKVKASNLVSQRIFERLGFSKGAQFNTAVNQFELMI